jgi:tripartite-type tricarboxylate transporter receptor subunit TctC
LVDRIENRPGGGSNIGTAAVVKAPPDGYTLLMVATSNVIATQLYNSLAFNFIRDVAPVAGTDSSPYVMVVSPSFPARTVPEFIAYAKANPGKINMGSNGVGMTLHLCDELFKMMTGVNMVHVPNRSGGQLNGQCGTVEPRHDGEVYWFTDLSATALAGTPTDFGKFIADETEKWGKVIRAANIKPE